MINGVIVQKLHLDEVLTELRSLGHVSVEQLDDDWRTRRAIERDLQIAVEIVIDVCQRILSLFSIFPETDLTILYPAFGRVSGKICSLTRMVSPHHSGEEASYPFMLRSLGRGASVRPFPCSAQ